LESSSGGKWWQSRDREAGDRTENDVKKTLDEISTSSSQLTKTLIGRLSAPRLHAGIVLTGASLI
jgi:hypothetical protein